MAILILFTFNASATDITAYRISGDGYAIGMGDKSEGDNGVEAEIIVKSSEADLRLGFFKKKDVFQFGAGIQGVTKYDTHSFHGNHVFKDKATSLSPYIQIKYKMVLLRVVRNRFNHYFSDTHKSKHHIETFRHDVENNDSAIWLGIEIPFNR